MDVSSESFDGGNDVHIRCRVRRSSHGSKELGQPYEMACIMRNWPTTSSSSFAKKRLKSRSVLQQASNNNSVVPELVLRQVSSLSNSLNNALDQHQRQRRRRQSEQFQSFGCTRSRRLSFTSPSSDVASVERSTPPRHSSSSPSQHPHHQQQRLAATGRRYSIPLSEVELVRHAQKFLFVTTRTMGYFEFAFVSDNGRDTMLTFLATSLSDDKIVSPTTETENAETTDQDSVMTSFDVEALTAKRIQERIREESLSEKFRRRMTHVYVQLEELSSTISECGCGGGGASSTTSTPASLALAQDERRQSPPRRDDTTGTVDDGHQHDMSMMFRSSLVQQQQKSKNEFVSSSSTSKKQQQQSKVLDLALEPELESVHGDYS